MNFVFVFMLASGSIFYQSQSKENCEKLAVAFANGEKVNARIEGEDVPILQGVCIRADQADQLQQLLTIQSPPMS